MNSLHLKNMAFSQGVSSGHTIVVEAKNGHSVTTLFGKLVLKIYISLLGGIYWKLVAN